jgi:hypothetical protein
MHMNSTNDLSVKLALLDINYIQWKQGHSTATSSIWNKVKFSFDSVQYSEWTPHYQHTSVINIKIVSFPLTHTHTKHAYTKTTISNWTVTKTQA